MDNHKKVYSTENMHRYGDYILVSDGDSRIEVVEHQLLQASDVLKQLREMDIANDIHDFHFVIKKDTIGWVALVETKEGDANG